MVTLEVGKSGQTLDDLHVKMWI